MLEKLWRKIKRFFKWLFFADHQIFFGRIPITLKGYKWELHITDEDPNPSVPHLHCIENSKLKIDVYTGEVYDDGINTGKLKDKEFNALWHDKKFFDLVKRSRDYYLEKHPGYQLVHIPFSSGDIDENVIISRGELKNQLIIEYKKDKEHKRS
ncbi:MAG: hypothetical protein HDT29_00220 [Clostridiales bacterium]|nr:hypothetical protein [Clostridiales bacterium]